MPRLRKRTTPYVAMKTLHGKRAGAGEPMAFIKAHVAHQGAECLFWPYAKSQKGYGEVQFEGRASRAHRVMCRLAHGEPPAPHYEASHTCNKGHEGCINPQHLVWETHAENHQRRVGKSSGARRATGIHSQAKLTVEQVLAIRADKRPERVIAKETGIGRATIGAIRSGRSWAWLKGSDAQA